MKNKDINSFKGARSRLRETILKILEKRPTASTLELAVLTGRSANDCRDILLSLQKQARVKKIGQASFSIWRLSENPKHEQLSEFRKPEKVL